VRLRTDRGYTPVETPGGNDTSDKIFVPSFCDVEKYLVNFTVRSATYNGAPSWWWMRSPGIISCNAAVVGSGGDGYLRATGLGVTGVGGVRPALIITAS